MTPTAKSSPKSILAANGDEAGDAVELIRQEEAEHGNDVKAMSIDGVGSNGPVLRELEDPEDLNVDAYMPVPKEPESELFTPQDSAGKQVAMYCCGPTVHDYAHIGNFRTFVFADLVRRYLGFRGYTVRHVMNITDVEDKIIRRVKESGESLAA